ncbi:hypothetical protein A3K69_05015 [Candidatus Bathyarchaeota archaeon RBG_16_57_9]|nr:MAG: hypothetical protein A3K69_05015 [Candidatus Bathyarchaeota archaeon RBG_16_57_9]
MPNVEIDDVVHVEDTHITVRGYRRRTTIPSGVFRFMGLKNGDVIRWVATRDGMVYIKKLVEVV